MLNRLLQQLLRYIDLVFITLCSPPVPGLLRGAVVLVCGGLFGYGLGLSTMISPREVSEFLLLNNLGLLLVLGSAVGVAAVFLLLAPRGMPQPLLGGVFERNHVAINLPLVLGALLFGIGWGMTGVCPGPALAGLGAGNWEMLWSLLGLLAGGLLHGLVMSWFDRRP
ncbi:hypothetical protein VITFI_CDS2654 [Vitreoscilla filiformis]|jgi:uncharacterized membrane protein YedE/YeeE|uniref:Uncharacterized protein n=1 Tax=Vitreoscilla filiformis TaxID=63 RepID=A0A221KHB9_VITFI|nr:DUF6691 family protein [Vitreoscilla filiformis]ASM78431.1 hypothetical protein VITFI_CDS2654 [Vitreoscilla filiformis]